MKKFALFAGLAALATVGGVFASWTFSNNTKDIALNDQTFEITADTHIKLDGLFGSVEISKNYGNGQMRIIQKTENSYVFGFENHEDEMFRVVYIPAEHEIAHSLSVRYSWSLTRVVGENSTLIVKNDKSMPMDINNEDNYESKVYFDLEGKDLAQDGIDTVDELETFLTEPGVKWVITLTSSVHKIA